MNNLTDKDWAWWPFLSLKPQQNQKITNAHLGKISLYFMGCYGGLFVIRFLIQKGISYLPQAVLAWAVFTAAFFIIYKFTFAYFWNVRAERLNKQE